MAVYSAIEEFISSRIESVQSSLVIICPFIKVLTLERLLNNVPTGAEITIVTTWKFKNFAVGVSDVEIYECCKQRGIRLLINNRIHLKLWVIDSEIILVTSANITDSAVGYSAAPNHEVLTEITAEAVDRKAVSEILEASTPLTEDVYEKSVELLKAVEIPEIDEVELVESDILLMNLVETLPITTDPSSLYAAYSSGRDYTDEVLHDLEHLKIPPGLSRDRFIAAVEKAYFRLPIVMKVCENLAISPMFFGEMKAFLQEINDSDPKPTRRELTPITQNLYRWLCKLKPEQFVIDQPNYSERITFKPANP